MLLNVCYNFKTVDNLDSNNSSILYRLISEEFGYTNDIIELLLYISSLLDSDKTLEYKTIEEQISLITSSLVFKENAETPLNIKPKFRYLSEFELSLDINNFKSEVDVLFYNNGKIRFSFVRGVCWELDELDYSDFKYNPPTVDMINPIEDISNFNKLSSSQIQAILLHKINKYKEVQLTKDIIRVGDKLYEKFNYFDYC